MTTIEGQIVINSRLSIAEAELRFKFALSGGPGGQHVNKTASKVILMFNVAESPSLNEQQRAQIMMALDSRMDKAGVLQVVSQSHRSQHRNKEEAVERLQQLLAKALEVQKKRRPTKPSRRQKERRLQDKKKRSEQKSQRRWRHDD